MNQGVISLISLKRKCSSMVNKRQSANEKKNKIQPGDQPGDKELAGIVLSLITFWLCAQTFLNLGQLVGKELNIALGVMNVIISLAALTCGMFIVMWGAIGDRWGRVKTIMLGNIMAIGGSLLIMLATAPESLAIVLLIFGRILQGMSAGAIMPAALSLINTYWEGESRARALSIFSMGTFGGMALSSSFGGVVTGIFNWRVIFLIAIFFALLGMFLLRDLPESAPQAGAVARLDLPGTISLALAMVACQLVLTQGAAWGWGSVFTLSTSAVFILSFACFIWIERHSTAPLIDFRVFANRQFTGALLANFCITASAGIITVSLWVLQGAGGLTVTTAGYLTLSYAIVLLLFIRVGEKVMNKFGKRLPMLLGTGLVFVSIVMLSMTNTMQDTYVVIGAIAFGIYGLGLALFATPATSMAMSALPSDQVGVGSGMFKMASSLGSAFGLAISAAVFTMLQTSGARVIGAFINYSGRQSNVAVREAGAVSLLILAIFAICAFFAVWFTAERKISAK